MTVANKTQAELTKKARRAEVHKLEGSAGERKNRGQTPEERRESYRKYHAIKRKVLELEKRNNSHLYLFPSSDSETNPRKFYNMGGNSAVIYCCDIGPKIKRKSVLRADADNGEIRFPFGVCSVVEIEKLEEKLRALGVKRLKDEEGGILVFKLSRVYSTDEIRSMLNSEQTKLDSLNSLIFSQVLYPEVHKLILELKRVIPPKVKNINREYREMFGADMIRSMRDLSLTYLRMTGGDVLPEEGAKVMLLDLSAILDTISLFNELRLWDVVTCIRISQTVIALRQAIKARILSKC